MDQHPATRRFQTAVLILILIAVIAGTAPYLRHHARLLMGITAPTPVSPSLALMDLAYKLQLSVRLSNHVVPVRCAAPGMANALMEMIPRSVLRTTCVHPEPGARTVCVL